MPSSRKVATQTRRPARRGGVGAVDGVGRGAGHVVGQLARDAQEVGLDSRCLELGLQLSGLHQDAGAHSWLSAEHSLALATALVPLIGYDAAAEIAKEAARSERTVREVARERTGLTEEQLTDALDPSKMTGPS